MDKLFRPFYLNLMVKNDKKVEFNKIASFASGLGEFAWDVETVIQHMGISSEDLPSPSQF